MDDLKVSVIIPIYKVEKYINQCIDSVLNQTYKNIEVILVDDGSPDNCPDICDNYAKEDNRVKVIHKENGGLSSARNAGIQEATGEYAIFIDSDDYWKEENGLQKLVERIEKTKACVLSFGYEKYDEDTGRCTPYFESDLVYHFPSGNKNAQLDKMTKSNLYIASACNKLIRLNLLKELPFQNGMVSEDIEWCARLLAKADALDFLNLNFYCYRQREGSIAHSISEKSCIDLKNAILGSAKIAETAEQDVRNYVYRYVAYQFSTFIAVQAFAKEFQKDCIRELEPYTFVLKYYGKSKKTKYMYIGTKVLGLNLWCKIIKSTKNIWDKLR